MIKGECGGRGGSHSKGAPTKAVEGIRGGEMGPGLGDEGRLDGRSEEGSESGSHVSLSMFIILLLLSHPPCELLVIHPLTLWMKNPHQME